MAAGPNDFVSADVHQCTGELHDKLGFVDITFAMLGIILDKP